MIAAASGWNPPWHGVIVLVTLGLAVWFHFEHGPTIERFFFRWTYRLVAGRWPE